MNESDCIDVQRSIFHALADEILDFEKTLPDNMYVGTIIDGEECSVERLSFLKNGMFMIRGHRSNDTPYLRVQMTMPPLLTLIGLQRTGEAYHRLEIGFEPQ